MEIQEYGQGRYTKERNKIEKYIARIIERFFVAEKEYAQSSAEAVITESLTRLKRSFITEKGFLFSFNGLTGNVMLDISSFGGEPSFAKNTAFNKDFGIVAGTVCEGSDIRLYNARRPLPHVHAITNISSLREELDKCTSFPSVHYHKNRSILDLIRYAGEKTEIDLMFIETTAESVKQYADIITFQKNELSLYQCRIKDTFVAKLQEILLQLETAKDAIKTAGAWLGNAKEYADSRKGIFNTEIRRLFHCYVTSGQMEELLCGVMYMAYDGEIPINGVPSVSLSQVEEKDGIFGDGNGDALKDIYDNGIQEGERKWQWDEALQSFVFQENLSSHSVFLSPGIYNDYVHRVTLSSSDADDDIISVILAYDDATGNMLSLMCSGGGVSAEGHSGPQAAIVFNFDGSWSLQPFGGMAASLTESTESTGWNTMQHGMAVLVKRTGNTFRAWVLYNSVHSWSVSATGDGHNDITTGTEPLFELNMEDYPELACFCGNGTRYGYGCYSQAMATYSDVCFIAHMDYGSWHGHTNINQQSSCIMQVPDSVSAGSNAGHVKMFFRYDTEDGGTETVPLPYMFIDENGTMVAIQGTYTEDGKITITSNLMQKACEYIDSGNFWDSRTIIVPSSDCNSYYSTIDFNGSLCTIDSQEKNDFVCSLLEDGMEYFINGTRTEPDDTWYADGDGMTYFNWDENGPVHHGVTDVIYINSNRKWSSSGYYTGGKGYIAEYRLKSINDYYKNPRVYYQVYGRME